MIHSNEQNISNNINYFWEIKKKKIWHFLQVGFGKSWVILPLYILYKLINNDEVIIISVPSHMLDSTEKTILESCLIYKNNFYYYTNKNIHFFFDKYLWNQESWIILLDHDEIKINFYEYYDKFKQMQTKINILIDEIDYFFDPFWLVLKYNIWNKKESLENIDKFYNTFNKYL